MGTNKAGEGERALVNGHHDTPVFQELLDGFIKKYVCCENCQLPEIAMNIKKGLIVGRCLVCGWAGNLDNNHKLAAFILKNPPDESGHGIILPTGAEGKGDKKSRREEKARKQAEGKKRGDDDEDSGSVPDSAEDEDEDKEEKKRKRKRKKRKRR